VCLEVVKPENTASRPQNKTERYQEWRAREDAGYLQQDQTEEAALC